MPGASRAGRRLGGGLLGLGLLLAPALAAAGETAPAALSGAPSAELIALERQFRAALAAIGAKDYPRAIDLLDTILAAHPDLVRVRLELARALFLTGRDDQRSQAQFERVLAGELPDAVRQNIQLFLRQIRARRVWTLSGSFGVAPDSNINAGPSSPNISIGGLPFQLNEEATQKSGVGIVASAGGSYRITLSERWRIQTAGSLYQRLYRDKDFDDSIAQWQLGPRYLFDRGEAGLAFVGYYRWYGLAPHSLALGGRLDGSYLLTDRLRLEAGLQLRQVEHFKLHDDDGLETDLDLTLRYAATPWLLGYVTLLKGFDDAREKRLRNDSQAITLGSYADLPWGVSLGLSARYEETDYHDPFFGSGIDTYRRDHNRQGSILLLSRDLRLLGAVPTFRYTRVVNDSSLEFFDYRRNLFEIGLTRDF